MIFDPHLKNAPGTFYVADGCCFGCHLAVIEASDVMEHEEGELFHCYFRKQPSDKIETEAAIRAISNACVLAVRYAGYDPQILEELDSLGCRDHCDALIPLDKIPHSNENT